MPFVNVGIAAYSATEPLRPFEYEGRDLRSDDVKIRVLFCGICHSDIHNVRSHWGRSVHYPIVPGHEFTGLVEAVGESVTRYKPGDRVGVGCMVDSCGSCNQCAKGTEQHCKSFLLTYNGKDRDGEITRGGYGKFVVVRENFVLRIPDALPMDKAAPLLCAGITTYSAAMSSGLKRGGLEVAVCGLGGLGHMAVQWAVAMGNKVTVLSRSLAKAELATKLGALETIATSDAESMLKAANRFDYILDTTSQGKAMDPIVGLLKQEGTLVLMAAPPADHIIGISAFRLIAGNRSIRGSLIGGIKETQEMLDYAAEKGILPWIELIKGDYVTEAYDRCERGDVHFRFVIDSRATFGEN
eukprot:Protomagalhaensia_wolfi_Nauph_80__1798@NODE_2120_length_1207_cov_1253_728596_g1658_i0_p1_GENE_NODE_2120_length_1207_cov_1253_728596_g1658_i0NODE_2120_length_1207_cov_1253_728596_g1658_i0_p1_ORF_typecomplete_len355_score47_71ADH_N/PF08240_12/2e29ADH_zinc_N/PF00107_26/1_4e21Glu_dehyd_C/PF16912_5/8_9e14Shikimate_DH/PF01488_20/4_5e06AlaDh_PNT_C/PF01262_21/8_7e06NAD_binding_10/PF13460_6/0_00019ADH_zinc_N_2/PF13602_6/0_00032Hacid_dh_C/PF02826_19/0_0021NAD_binding_2/PF03446_15/0_0035AdoHcyase_NAD/PF006